MGDTGAEAVVGGKRRIDRVLSGDYVESLDTLALPELRELRDEAEQEEADLSFLRRMLQGRIDILGAELDRRRRSAAGEPDAGSLIANLPQILADAARPAVRGMGRHSSTEATRVSEHRRRVEQLAGDISLSDVGVRTEDELGASLDQLQAAEEEVSAVRRQVHEVLDACAAEITRRYRDGEADVDALLAETPPA
ncbi:MAG TPA: aerial mycelium formation protein [Mycobacteriales bacterium]|nr:aerial mycelium formation protein [Mycobacteriales bacterium]